MRIRRQLVLPALVMVAGFGAFASAQTKKPAAKKAAATRVRVFFVEPKNGATVISPVPPGDLTKAQVRPGKAHYHVGIDQVCLPPGKTIVKGTPSWVHFGDGKDVFDSQLTPGKHKLALQLGDDLHDTMPGACSVITVNVK